MRTPKLYATFLLWLLAELFEVLPEVGDPDKPKLVFFFDEAHLLFEDAPEALLETVEQAFTEVGGLIERHRQKAALAEAMRTVAEVNKYVSDSAPWKLKGDHERERLGTVLHVMAQAVADCNLLLSPFLPHSANAVDRVLGGAGDIAPMPEIREVDDLDGGPGYPVITGDYSGAPRWQRRPVVPGTAIDKPTPVFTKLDPGVVDDELARLAVGRA